MSLYGIGDPTLGTETYGSGGLFYGAHGMPRVSAWISFTTNPGDTPVWEDVTDYLRAFTIKRGRQYELDQFAAGTATITLDNRDRRFDPTYTSSPYYPNVLPMRRIQLRATWGLDYTIFDGYVDGWPQSYNVPHEARVDVGATDLFKVLQLTKYPSSVYAYYVEQDAPVHWWRLSEQQGTVAHDSGSSPLDATLAGNDKVLTYSATGMSPFDSDTAIQFIDPNADGGGYFTVDTSITSGDFSVEFWCDTTAVIGTPLCQGTPGNTNKLSGRTLDWEFTTDSVTILDGSGNFVRKDARMEFLTAGGTLSSGFLTSLADPGWHHFVVTRSGTTVTLYCDGVSVASHTDTSSFAGGLIIGPMDVYAAGLVVGLDEIAIYNYALSAGSIENHYNGAVSAWAGFSTEFLIVRALAQAGVTITQASLDAGLSTMGSAVLNNTDIKSYLEGIELAEGGDFFIGADGTPHFYNRHHLITPPGNVSAAIYGDNAGEQMYSDIVVTYDDTHIINEARITRAGGTTQIAEDATSQATYLKRTFEQSDVQTETDTDSLYRAQGLVAEKKDAHLRVDSMVIKPQRDPFNLWPLVLGTDLLTLLTVKRRPQALGSAISQNVVLEGIQHDATPDTWKTTYQLGQPPLSGWILGDATYSVLGSTTRLAA